MPPCPAKALPLMEEIWSAVLYAKASVSCLPVVYADAIAETVALSTPPVAAADIALMELTRPRPTVSAVDEYMVISPFLVTSIRSWRAECAVPSPIANAAESPVAVSPSPWRLYEPNTVAWLTALLLIPCAKEYPCATEYKSPPAVLLTPCAKEPHAALLLFPCAKE